MSLQAVNGRIELKTAVQALGLPIVNDEPGMMAGRLHQTGQVSQVNLDEFFVFFHGISPEYGRVRSKPGFSISISSFRQGGYSADWRCLRAPTSARISNRGRPSSFRELCSPAKGCLEPLAPEQFSP